MRIRNLLLVSLASLWAGPVIAAGATNEFTLPAWAFDRGNARVFTDQWADAGPMVAFGGDSPVIVEYDIEFPVSAEYTLYFEYAAAAARPVDLTLDDTSLEQVCRAVTGSWNTSGRKWERGGVVPISKGKHTLRLERDNDFPHLVSIRFESSAPLPAGWALKLPAAPKPGAAPSAPKFRLHMPTVDCAALRAAIADLMTTFGARYPRGPEFLRRLDALEQQQKPLEETFAKTPAAERKRREPAALAELRKQLAALQREALLANPLLDFDRLLFIKRRPNAPLLGLPANWQSNSSLPLKGYDDSLCLLSLADPELPDQLVFKPEKGLFVGDVDLNYDAAKLLFSMPGTNQRWQVFELALPTTPATDAGKATAETPAPAGNEVDRSRAVNPWERRNLSYWNRNRSGAQPAVKAAERPASGVDQTLDLAARWSDLSQLVLRQLTGEQPDVDSYDACYLPDGRIVFTSTAYFVGVPCVYGSSHVANLYLMDGDGRNIRQLCFDQEHDWCPTVLNNGRVLYTRWEYTDTPHSNTRLLFHMNPDGTQQMEFLGSNSYWPNSFFYARPIPGHPSKIISVISGHHGDRRMGELVVFDPLKGRFEAEGAVQKIPGHGKKVEMVFRDQLTVGVWPKFLHPFPLSEKYFVVACQPEPRAPWGIYLVDVFDNLVPVKQLADYALFEPVPLRPIPRPPAIPDKVNLQSTNAVVYIQDIYAGDGLKGLPPGTVKSLRVLTYHFSYQGMGGLLGVLGMDGPWDIKQVLGTVPVEADGSAKFRIPANTPVSLQPLDQEGKALQLMRSWMTGMPGEVVQCTGCHERQNSTPAQLPTLALSKSPAEIAPWHGPPRGFSYPREVQPVIDKYCVGCHNGQPQPDGEKIIDLRGTVKIADWKSVTPGNGGQHAGKFSVGYAELHRFVRRPGIESDYHLLEPMEFHADTTELVQLLKRGHYHVKLDAEGWDRLITWIDLNCPYHGTWSEELDNPGRQVQRRRELLKLYAGVDSDPERVPPVAAAPATPVMPEEPKAKVEIVPGCDGWPFDAVEARRRQAAAGSSPRKTVQLADGIGLELALIPAGEFIMGARGGQIDERPLSRVRIAQPFWMATREIDNRTYARFDPAHDSRIEDKNAYQFGVHGYPVNRPEQPVVRVSWDEARAFCQWLSAQTGRRFDLPTEAQWEYACRAGANTAFYFGDLGADFSKHANLADATLSDFASDPYTVDVPLKNPTPYDDWMPKDARFKDGALLTVAPGSFLPNAWGLYDLHGNAAEWTRSNYLPYPVSPGDGRETATKNGRKAVRGGSWRDVPGRGTASFRLGYRPYQKVFNVGFRVICEIDDETLGRNEIMRPVGWVR